MSSRVHRTALSDSSAKREQLPLLLCVEVQDQHTSPEHPRVRFAADLSDDHIIVGSQLGMTSLQTLCTGDQCIETAIGMLHANRGAIKESSATLTSCTMMGVTSPGDCVASHSLTSSNKARTSADFAPSRTMRVIRLWKFRAYDDWSSESKGLDGRDGILRAFLSTCNLRTSTGWKGVRQRGQL